MTAAPAVDVVCTGDAFARRAAALLAALAAAAGAAWGVRLGGGADGLAAAAGAIAAVFAAVAVAGRPRRAAVVLRWDGAAWSVRDDGSADAVAGHARVAIDLGGWLLLRFDAAAGAPPRRWIALARRDHRARWHALRCALFARQADADPLAATRI